MGGPGSGNDWHFDAKRTTDDYFALDVRAFARAGALRPGYRGHWSLAGVREPAPSVHLETEHGRVTLRYRHRCDGSWKSEEYPVTVVRTRCHFGGSRPWFRCPVRGCGRRVAILFGGGIFACRYCHKLAYTSTREEPGARAARRAERIRVRLGSGPGVLNSECGKPKWMRWRTFQRLTACYNELRLVGRHLG
jgi:hypothetical protein